MPDHDRNRTIEVLLVEDNPGDVRMMQEAFRELALPHRISVAGTGRTALEFLRHQNGYHNAPRPDLVLLDLALPDIHGLEVLAAVKSDPALRRIPAVVFSSSRKPDEIGRAYDLNANSYIAKPVDLPDFIRVVKGVEDFWLTVVKLPRD